MKHHKYLKIEEIRRAVDRFGDRNVVYFKIADQSHRCGRFGGRVNAKGQFVDGEEFIASNGIKIISRGNIQPKPNDKIFFVRGTVEGEDDMIVSTTLAFYEKIVAAVADYNRTFFVKDFGVPEDLFTLE
jgi:hypothetical protein